MMMMMCLCIACAGFISKLGLEQSPPSPSISQLQGLLSAVLKEATTRHITLPIQLAALDSLLEASPLDRPSSEPMLGVVRAWLQAQRHHPWGQVLSTDIENRLRVASADAAPSTSINTQ